MCYAVIEASIIASVLTPATVWGRSFSIYSQPKLIN
jgi:hypothetical protein